MSKCVHSVYCIDTYIRRVARFRISPQVQEDPQQYNADISLPSPGLGLSPAFLRNTLVEAGHPCCSSQGRARRTVEESILILQSFEKTELRRISSKSTSELLPSFPS